MLNTAAVDSGLRNSSLLFTGSFGGQPAIGRVATDCTTLAVFPMQCEEARIRFLPCLDS